MDGDSILSSQMIELKHLMFIATAIAISSCDSSNNDGVVNSFTPPEINGYMLTSFTVTDGNEQIDVRSVYKFDNMAERLITKYIFDVNDEEVADTKYSINSNGTVSSLGVLELGTDTFRQTQLLTYDSVGRLSRIESKSGEISEFVDFQYQGNQLSTKRITSTVGPDVLIFTYGYNEKNVLESIKMNDNANELVDTTFLFYDGSNRLERAEYDESTDGVIDEVQVFDRDSNGNVISIKYYDEYNILLKTERFSYEKTDIPLVNLVEFNNFYLLL